MSMIALLDQSNSRKETHTFPGPAALRPHYRVLHRQHYAMVQWLGVWLKSFVRFYQSEFSLLLWVLAVSHRTAG